MSDTIKISLDTSQYRLPTQEEITSGKQFILRREEYARVLVAKIDDCLANAAQEIVTICYKYNVDPQKFAINSEYNEQMIEEHDHKTDRSYDGFRFDFFFAHD